MDSVSLTAHPDDIANNKKMRSHPSLPHEVNDLTQIPVIATATANMLCEDELSLIFKNLCLSTKDLLNFRFVSKIWRDAATSALLRRNACYVTLENKALAAEEKATRGGMKTYFSQLEDKKEVLTLTQLTYLMSKSPKFPASSVLIHLNINYLKDPSSVTYSHHPDLLMFFKLHGDKIKTLRIHRDFCLKDLLNILYTYTPNIQCLDLTESHPLISEQEEEEKENGSSKWNLEKCIPVESLLIGSSYRYRMYENIHLLITSLPKLRSIENVDGGTLIKVLDEHKAGLIRGFKYSLSSKSPETYLSAQQKFAQIKPQLFNLKLIVSSWCSVPSTSVNELLESSQNTLRQLELSVRPYANETKLRICRMKILKVLLLGGKFPLDDTEEQVGQDEAYSIFEDGMSAPNCFPALVKLCLTNLKVETNIMY